MSENKKKMGIKETKELIEVLGLLGSKAKAIAKDGIGVNDIAAIVELAKEFDTILEGFKGLDVALEEVKDLDQGEVIELIGALYTQADKINKA